MKEASIAIVYASRFGHTKMQAEAIAREASANSAVTVKLYTAGEAIERIDELDHYDAIIFGSATYMGNMAAEMKSFIEHAAGKWQNRSWKNKIAGGFTSSSNFSGDKFNTLMGLFIQAMQQGMIWVGVDLLPACNVPDSEKTVEGPGAEALNRVSSSIGPMAAVFRVKIPEAPSSGDIATAEEYGQRIAEITLTFRHGTEK